MHKYSLKKAVEWYKSRFFLSREMRSNIVDKNLSNLISALFVLFLYGVAGFCYDLARYFDRLHVVYYELWYFGSFIITSFICILSAHIIKKIKNTPYYIKAFPYGFAIACICAHICYTILVMHNAFRGIVLLASLGIVTVLVLYVEPLYFSAVILLVNIAVDSFIKNTYGREGLLDIVILSGLLVILSLYKQKRTKYDLLRTKMLEENRDALQDAVAGQIQEIQEQNKELQVQHERIVTIQNNTIISLSNLVENRDSDTGEHVRRTSAYVNLLAAKAKNNGYFEDEIDDDFISLLTKAAPMHDIGKIVVPDNILKKPGKLNDEEFEQIKRHTTEGGRIVREVLGEGEEQDYVDMAIELATSHHERWDGSGYPKGLKGNDIPLSARIMAIADVFDALVSPRCYKEPFSVDKAMKIIHDEAGSHFDPVLATLFVGMEDDAVAVMEKYKD